MMAVMGLVSILGLPAVVDSTLHDGPVVERDSSDKKHLDVMFNCDKL